MPQFIQFIQFIKRTPTLKALKAACVTFDDTPRVEFASRIYSYGESNLNLTCEESDWQVLSLEQLCTSCLPPLSMLEDLYIQKVPDPDWDYHIENEPWLDLRRLCTAVKNFYLSKEAALRIAPVLQDLVGGKTAEVLPTLQNIYLGGLQRSERVPEGIRLFAAARQVTDNQPPL